MPPRRHVPDHMHITCPDHVPCHVHKTRAHHVTPRVSDTSRSLIYQLRPTASLTPAQCARGSLTLDLASSPPQRTTLPETLCACSLSQKLHTYLYAEVLRSFSIHSIRSLLLQPLHHSLPLYPMLALLHLLRATLTLRIIRRTTLTLAPAMSNHDVFDPHSG